MTRFTRGRGDAGPRLTREPGNGPKVKPLVVVKTSFPRIARGGASRGVGGDAVPVSPSRALALACPLRLAAKRGLLEVPTYGGWRMPIFAASHPRTCLENHRSRKTVG